MVLNIYKSSDFLPEIGTPVFIWGVNNQNELELLGRDEACELVVWEVNEDGSYDQEYSLEVENEIEDQGFILNVGWLGTGENIHNDDYWSYLFVE